MTAMMRCADGVISVVEPPMMLVFLESGVMFGSGLVLPFPLPQHGWLKKPLQEDIRWNGVAFSTDTSKDVRCLITLSSHMVELEPLEPR